MDRRVLAVVGSLATTALATGLAGAADWPRYRGPAGSGVSAETGWSHASLASGPEVAWRAEVGSGHSGPVVAGGRVFLVGNTGQHDVVHCLDAATGRELWKRGYPSEAGTYEGPRATPTVVGDQLIMVSRWGEVLSLETASGKLQWRTDLTAAGAELPQWGLASSAVVDGGTVLVNAASAGMALDLASGKVLWSSPKGVGGYASPVLLDGRDDPLVAIFGAKELALVKVADGRRVAALPWETRYDVNAADPLVVPAGLFVSSGYGRGGALVAIVGTTLEQRWFSEDLAAQLSTPVLIGGHLYGVSGNTGRGALTCLRLTDGTMAWSEMGGFESLTAAGSRLITLDRKGDLVIVEATPGGYHELARAHVLDAEKAEMLTAPVLANGRIYCRNSLGSVVCLDVGGS